MAYTTLVRDLRADIEMYEIQGADFAGRRASLLRKLGILLTPALMCVLLYRVSHWLWSRGWRAAGRLVGWVNYVVHRADISPAAAIGPGLYIPHTVGIVFHGSAGARLALFAHACVAAGVPRLARHLGTADCPRLGDNVAVGAYALVLGAVVLDSGVRVGPQAVVTRDVPADCAVVARRGRQRSAAASAPVPLPQVA